MKKSLKIYKWSWVAVITATLIAILIVTVSHISHHELAEDPNNLDKILKVDLPDVANVESENDLSRGASRWDVYIHHGLFSEELSGECIRKMDELCVTDTLHWQKGLDKGYYSYSDEGGIDGLYFVTCTIYNDKFVLIYEVDESEGIFLILPFAIAYSILVKWGVVLMIIELININKHRKQI